MPRAEESLAGQGGTPHFHLRSDKELSTNLSLARDRDHHTGVGTAGCRHQQTQSHFRPQTNWPLNISVNTNNQTYRLILSSLIVIIFINDVSLYWNILHHNNNYLLGRHGFLHLLLFYNNSNISSLPSNSLLTPREALVNPSPTSRNDSRVM